VKRFLLLGGTGQVGEEFRALTLPDDIKVVAPNRGELDLQDPRAITRTIAAQPWSAVINAAAYTDVDRAESQEPVAFAVNAEAPSRLAAESGVRGIPLIHISTDYVFDGRKGAPYVEQDEVAPLNAYGRTKLAGERGVRAGNPQHVILRTSWVYSPFRKNFVRTILRLAGECERLTIVADQRGCPTAARDIALACRDIAIRCALQPKLTRYGVYHFAGAGGASWFEFASAIVEMAADRLGRLPKIIPIPTSEYPTSAVRAADTRLDCAAVARDFGIEARPWRQALADTIDRLLRNKSMP
jgi:dTDP-4-dehydrorhamnose reductase